MNLAMIMKQVRQLQERIAEMKAELATKTVEGYSGGGMVKAIANGNQEIVAIRYEEGIFNELDHEMISDLTAAAVNDALRRSKDMMNQEMSRLGAEMGLPIGDFMNMM
jgi:DNA-binding YbaB/EbfC family protein